MLLGLTEAIKMILKERGLVNSVWWKVKQCWCCRVEEVPLLSIYYDVEQEILFLFHYLVPSIFNIAVP